MDDDRIVRLSADIAAPRSRVWRAWTRAADLCAWDPDEVSGDLGPGAEARFAWRHLGVARDMEVTGWIEDRHLALRSPAPEPVQALEVDLDDADAGAGTTMALRFSGFDSVDQRAGAAAGWRAQIAQLARYLERHDGEARAVSAAAGMVEAGGSELFDAIGSREGLRSWFGEVEGELREGATVALHAGGLDLGGEVLVRAEPYELVVGCEHLPGLLRLRALPLLAPRATVVAAILSTWGEVPARAALEAALVAAVDRLVASLGPASGEA